MQQPRNIIPQEVPAEFAAQLRKLRDAGGPGINAVLAAARTKGWRTATLANVLGINPTACSKRIERATAPTTDGVARTCLTIAAHKMFDIGEVKVGKALLEHAADPTPSAELSAAAQLVADMDIKIRAVRTARRAIERAARYSPERRFDISSVHIPDPPERPKATMDGRKLAPEEVAELVRLKELASRVNGATPSEIEPGKKHPLRQASEDYSKMLHDLIVQRGFTPYYLARIMGVTHRAITSRLERHGYRTPCPSVRGTPSGVYLGRKIGEAAAA